MTGKGFEDVVQAAGRVVDFHRHDCGAAHGEARFLHDVDGFFRIVDNEAEDAEVGRVRKGQRADVDSGVRQRFGHLRQTAGLVFKKNGKLFDFHDAFLA